MTDQFEDLIEEATELSREGALTIDELEEVTKVVQMVREAREIVDEPFN